MATIPVTLVGSAYLSLPQVNPLAPVPVTIVADMSYTGLGVGGGPIVPPAQPPSGAHPEHPIFWPPGTQPHPEHPIVLPPDLPPTLPPPDNRPVEWKTAWSESTGWIVIGIPTGPTPTPSTEPAPPA